MKTKHLLQPIKYHGIETELCIRSLFWLYIFLTPAAFGNLVYNYLFSDLTDFQIYGTMAFSIGLIIVRTLKTFYADKEDL